MARKSVGTFEDRFLAKLEEQPEVRDSGITNERLREILGWNSDRFDSTKQSLLEQGKIERARGRGGLIKLVGTSEPEPTVKQKLKVFISYSHVDTDQKKALHSHLRPLERLELIESWSDRSIRAGDHIDESIRAQVEAADIFLLLISIDFINSIMGFETFGSYYNF